MGLILGRAPELLEAISRVKNFANSQAIVSVSVRPAPARSWWPAPCT